MLGSRIREELKQSKTLLQYGVPNAIGQALGMIAPLVIAKFLSPELFASYTLAKLIAFLFLTLLISAAQTPFIVLANQERAATGKINKAFSVQCLFLVTGFCVSSAVMLGLRPYAAAFARMPKEELSYVYLAFGGFAIESFLVNLFMAMGQRVRGALVELVFGVLTVGLVFVLYWAGAFSVRNVFVVHFAAAIGVALIFVWAVDYGKLRPLTIDRQQLAAMFDFTKWVMLGSAAVYVINWGDSIVLRGFDKPFGDIGTYNLGYGIFKGILTLIFMINSYFLPFVSEHTGDKSVMRAYLYEKRPRIILASVVMIGLLFVFSPYFFKAVYGNVYQESATVLRILLVGCVLMLYSIFYYPIFHSLKKYKYTQTLNIVQAGINLVLDLLLVPTIGMLGAAVGAVSGYFCTAVAVEIYFRVKIVRLLKL